MQHCEFIYILRLKENLHKHENWTDLENSIVREHLEYLKDNHQAGKVILAGRTQLPLPETFGIVILKVDTEEDALILMQNDPAVKNGIMEATLYPYGIAVGK